MAGTKIIAVFIVALCSIVSLSQATTKVKYCDKNTDYKVKVSGVDINPNPVRSGEPATFSIYATTDAPISGGKLSINVAYYGWYIHSETHDLSAETTCPVAAGAFVVSHSQTLPSITPPGSYTLKMKMYGEEDDDKELTCITFDFKIQWGSSVAAM